MATVADVRAEFVAAFGTVPVTVYDYVPPVVSTPALFVFPDEPYLKTRTIGRGAVRASVRLRLIVAVAALDNRASLANLENLLVEVTGSLPQGWSANDWDKPSIDAVGPSDLLVSTMSVEKIETLTLGE